MKKFTIVFFAITILISSNLWTQGVAINNTGTDPDSSAILDVSSDISGILIPRLTMALRDAISTPATGLMIYQTDNTHGFYYYSGSSWVPVNAADNDWTVSGNDMYSTVSGNVGIGTSTPTANIDVRGAGTDAGTIFNLGNSDNSHRLLLFPGRENDPNPFIQWKEGDPLRFSTDEGGWSEKMRISSDGKIGIGNEAPFVNLDIRSSSISDASRFRLENLDQSNSLFLFSGHETADPYISFKGGDALRFMRYEGGIHELMRIQSDGRMGIGTDNPNESALLELNSNSRGFLLPRMTSGEISSIQNPSDGLQVYNTDDGKLYIFVNTLAVWQEISYGSSSLPTSAAYEIGTGNSCNNTIINGNYYNSMSLALTEFVTIEVNVLSVGNYLITTDTINGYWFSTSGIFYTTGIHAVDLMSIGIPISAQTDFLTVTASNGGGTCTFSIIVEANPIGCNSPFTDPRDGQDYNLIQIGNQCWMAENLNTGTMISHYDLPLDNGIIEKYCHDDDTINCDIYGGLYIWDEMMQYVTTEGVQGICPNGWHLPTDAEWCTLENEVDTGTISCSSTLWRGIDAGGNLKETGTVHWISPNIGATNSSGFTALPGGYRDSGGIMILTGDNGNWWTSTEDTITNIFAWYRYLYNDEARILRYNGQKIMSFSVRCVKD